MKPTSQKIKPIKSLLTLNYLFSLLLLVSCDVLQLQQPNELLTFHSCDVSQLQSSEVVAKDGFILISTKEQLLDVNQDLKGKYRLVKDIELACRNSNALIAPDQSPEADFQGEPFSGVFDGGGHRIKQLQISHSSGSYAGLFGSLNKAVVSNLKLTGIKIALPGSYLGALAGKAKESKIEAVSAAGEIKALGKTGKLTGGLVGSVIGGTLNNSDFNGIVEGNDNIGGLVGYSVGLEMAHSHASGTVRGYEKVGGLVGALYGNIGKSIKPEGIYYSYFSGTVKGDFEAVGGLVGWVDGGMLYGSYLKQGKVSGVSFIGGLVGIGTKNLIIIHSYAEGTVEGTTSGVGGLVGMGGGWIIDAYSTAAVSGASSVGGLVGHSVSPTSLGGVDDGNSRSISNTYTTGKITRTTGSSLTFGSVIGSEGGSSSGRPFFVNNYYDVNQKIDWNGAGAGTGNTPSAWSQPGGSGIKSLSIASAAQNNFKGFKFGTYWNWQNDRWPTLLKQVKWSLSRVH